MPFPTKRDIAVSGLLVALCAIFLGPALVGKGLLFGSDVITFFYPLRAFGFGEMARGRVALWNPHIYCGTPNLAGLQSALLYPLNLLYVWLPIEQALNWSRFASLALSGLGMLYACRVLGMSAGAGAFAGLTYALNGYTITHLYAGHVTPLDALPWVPPVIALLLVKAPLGRGGLRAGGLLALTFLAGHPQYFYYALLAVAGVAVWHLAGVARKNTGVLTIGKQFGVALVTCGLLTAGQLLPTLQMSGLVIRNIDTDFTYFTETSLAPAQLLGFVAPLLFGDGVEIDFVGEGAVWETTGFFGVAALLLAIVGFWKGRRKERWFFGALALGSLALAMGSFLPGYSLFFTVVPGLSTFRVASRILFLTVTAACFLAGMGWEALTGSAKGKPDTGLPGWPFGLAGMGLYLGCRSLTVQSLVMRLVLWLELTPGMVHHYPPSPEAQNLMLGAVHHLGMVLLALFPILELLRLRLWKFQVPGRVLLLLLATWELFAFGSRYLRLVEPSEYFYGKNLFAFAARDPRPSRVLTFQNLQFLDLGMVWGYENLHGGNDPLILKRYASAINFMERQPLEKRRDSVILTGLPSFVGELNARYALFPPGGEAKADSWRLVFEGTTGTVWENRPCKPRWEFFPKSELVKNQEEALIHAKAFPENTQTAWLERTVQSSCKPTGEGPVEISELHRLAPNRMTGKVKSQGNGWLLIREPWYPGWEVTVDGTKITGVPSQGLGFTVPICEGASKVEVAFTSPAFELGFFGTLMGILAVLMMGLGRKGQGEGALGCW